jgi:hypothetical protein
VQVDGGRAKESKLNDDDSNTDDDDDDDENESKMPADGEEDPKEEGDDWSLVPKLDTGTKRWQCVAKKDDDTQVRFALRLCQRSTLKIVVISFAFSTSLDACVGQDDGTFEKSVRSLNRKRVSKAPDRHDVKGEPANRKRSKSKRDGKRRVSKKRDQRPVEVERVEAKSKLCEKTVTDLFFHCMNESDYFKVNGSIELHRRLRMV